MDDQAVVVGAVFGAGFAALFGVVGLLVGSFLNVCIYRLPRQQSIVWPASRCGACARPLAWFENVPLLSWLVLGGRCRTCGERISVMYPAVEAATGAIFFVALQVFGWTPLLAVRLLFACALVVLFGIDLRHRILPNGITLPGVVVGLVCSAFLPPGLPAALLGAALGAGVLFAIGEAYYRLRGIDGLGMGDVKMLGMIGAFLGWRQTLVTLVLASVLGSLVGVGVILSRRGGLQAALPFGTFLAAGALVAAVAGETMLAWYLSFY
jgi:leader peptidase (prepilin peptidase)/N-methyltransferase